MTFVAAEDLVDAIEILRAARVAGGAADMIVFIGGEDVAFAASYLDAWIGATRPNCGRAVIARPHGGAVNVVLAGPVVHHWKGLLGSAV